MPSGKVELSGLASMQYDKFLAYIYFVLKNPHKKHRYLLVYRVKNDRVIVEGMYHELQDYENAIGV